MKLTYSKLKRNSDSVVKDFIALWRQKQSTVPVFIAGAQRSGTSMTLRALEKSVLVKAYGEGDEAFFRDYRLPSVDEVQKKLDQLRYPVAVAKPLVDSQHMSWWLKEIPELKVIWIFRDYNQVIRSANKKWPGHQLDVIHRIASRDWESLGWRGENIADTTLKAFDELYHPELNEEEGGAMMWWLRNRIVFDQNLCKHQGVFLVQYEDLVTQPSAAFHKLYSWLGIPFKENYVEEIHQDSMDDFRVKNLDNSIQSNCEALLKRLQNCSAKVIS